MVKMIRIVLIMQLILSCNIVVIAQEVNSNDYEVELGRTYEQLPVFVSETDEHDLLYMYDYIQKSIIYPISAINDTIEGCVLISYTVDTCGCVSNAKFVKSVRKYLDDEALRVIHSLKFKSPAKYKKKPLTFSFTIPIWFELSNKLQQDSISNDIPRTHNQPCAWQRFSR